MMIAVGAVVTLAWTTSMQPRTRIAMAAMPAEDGLRLPISSLSAGLTAAIQSAAEQEMKDLAASGGQVDLRALELDEEMLGEHKTRLLGEVDMEANGLIFRSDGSPSPTTLGTTLVLTARLSQELDYPSIADLVAASESGSNPTHTQRAGIALATVVSDTLAEMEAAEMDGVQAESAEDARSVHIRWATLEMARARYAGDRPEGWGSLGK